jgi:RNA polymerase sigma-54 factor
MKQSLQLKLGQQLTMTPQLQQAIRLLQLSTLDLQQEIQQALDSNPLLELSEDDSFDPADLPPDELDSVSGAGSMQNLEQTASGSLDDGSEWTSSESNEPTTMPDDLPVGR